VSADTGAARPAPDQLREAQALLLDLESRCEAEPRYVLEQTQKAAPLLASWTSSDAYAWLMLLRARAHRYVDDLPGICDTVDTVLKALRGDEVVVAYLELEKGMALNQFGRPLDAATSLVRASDVFASHREPGGRAWALVSLAEAYCGSGYSHDPEPLLQEALELSRSVGDDGNGRRAWKQLAVVLRHRGEAERALDAIERALVGTLAPHVRANFVLERGHLLSWLGDFANSDADYEEAAAVYLHHGDLLGLGNVERALATNALLLGRLTDGLMRLKKAASHYQRLDNETGLGYVLRESSSIKYAQGDRDGALSDTERSLQAFRRSADAIGLAGALTGGAQLQYRLGHVDQARELLTEALTLTATGTNPLARAGALLLEAEIGSDATAGLQAARASAALYSKLRLWTGEAAAHARSARILAEGDDGVRALASFRAATEALRRARVEVVDPGRRADHDFALRDVTAVLLGMSTLVSGPAIQRVCADLLLDLAPLGLRADLAAGGPGREISRFITRVASLPMRQDPDANSQRHLLQQLAAVVATVVPGAPTWCDFDALRDAHQDDAVLVIGAPQHDRTLPIAWAGLGADAPRFTLVHLSKSAVEHLDALGRVTESGREDVLWTEGSRGWQTELVDIVLPAELQQQILQPRFRVTVLLPPVLAHVPIEALLINGVPLGVRAAVTRIPAPNGSPAGPAGRITFANGYLDPALPWRPERALIPQPVTDAASAPGLLGADRVTLIGCHGSAGTRLGTTLVSTKGERVLDAIDLLRQPLSGSSLVLESCSSGRFLGDRTGEQLTLASVALVAGAHAVVAGLFNLPADDITTGAITTALVANLVAGLDPAEALRLAREAYWKSRPATVMRPGAERGTMPSDAPWAWAGLVAFSR
jgi:tetratricopeptide (TPR) repeat protein